MENVILRLTFLIYFLITLVLCEAAGNFDGIISANSRVSASYQQYLASEEYIGSAYRQLLPICYINYNLFKTENLDPIITSPNTYTGQLSINFDWYLLKNGLNQFRNILDKELDRDIAKLTLQNTFYLTKKEYYKLLFEYYIAKMQNELSASKVYYFQKIFDEITIAYKKGEKSDLEYSNAQIELESLKAGLIQENINIADLMKSITNFSSEDLILTSLSITQIIDELFFSITTAVTLNMNSLNISNNIELQIYQKKIEKQCLYKDLISDQNGISLKIYYQRNFYKNDETFNKIQQGLDPQNNSIGLQGIIYLLDPSIESQTNAESKLISKLKNETNTFTKEQELLLNKVVSSISTNMTQYIKFADLQKTASKNLKSIESLYSRGTISFIELQNYFNTNEQISIMLLNYKKNILLNYIDLLFLTNKWDI